MNQINFLPESFQRARRRQQRRPIEFVVIACTLAGLVGAWLMTSGPDHAMAAQTEALDRRLDQVGELRAEETRLTTERMALQRKLMTARETYQPINATQVLSRLSRLMPEPIRLINLQIMTQRPAPQPQAKAKAVNKKIIGHTRQAKTSVPSQMKVALTGHAPSDEQLVTLIRRLTADPVFTDVTLRSSKQDKTQTHFVRAFHLDVVIALDRRFVAPVNGGTHDAD